MKDLKKKSIKDIEKMLREKKKALREFRFDSAGSKVRNVKEGRNLKLDIARMLTELTRRNKEEVT